MKTDILIPIVFILGPTLILAMVLKSVAYKQGYDEGYKASQEDTIKKIDSLLDADAKGKFIDEKIIILTK